jgi:hypothetical protein
MVLHGRFSGTEALALGGEVPPAQAASGACQCDLAPRLRRRRSWCGAALVTDGTRSKGSTSFTLQYVSPRRPRCRSLAGRGDGGSGLDSERNPLPVLASMMVTPVWCRSHLGGDLRYYFGIIGGAWMLMFDVGGGAMILCSSHWVGDDALCLLACTLWGNGL